MPSAVPPTPDDGASPDDLLLDQARLLERLRQARDADSVEALREQVDELRRLLNGDVLRAGDTDAVPFPRAYLEDQLNQIATARTLERARYYVGRLLKSATSSRTRPVNDLDLNRWQTYDDLLTDSLWLIERRDNSGVHSAGYWGNFIPQIPYQLMRRYTRPGDWVLDTFAGAGTTLIEAQRLGRNCLGAELQPDTAGLARRQVAAEPNPHGVTAEVVTGDSTTIDWCALLAQYGRVTAQLVLMHPPYFDIIKFSDDPRDLSNAPSIDAFVAQLGAAVGNVAPALERGRYLALVIGDTYTRGEWIPLGFRVMEMVLARGFSLKSIVVKNFEQTTGKRRQQELWRYRALLGGFYIFKHEYIFLFRKR